MAKFPAPEIEKIVETFLLFKKSTRESAPFFVEGNLVLEPTSLDYRKHVFPDQFRALTTAAETFSTVDLESATPLGKLIALSPINAAFFCGATDFSQKG